MPTEKIGGCTVTSGTVKERTPQTQKPGIVETLILKLVPQTFSLLQRSQSSIEIKQNAKGTAEFVVKCYADSIEEAQANGLQSFLDLRDKLKGINHSE
jgi:hypothetical protein